MTRKEAKKCDDFAALVVWFARRYYCCGAADESEIMAAVVAWLEGWAENARRYIPEGTVCPSRR